mmetsp:Transcript_13354/g.31295  ORF Transcript_13354/g.31295 Transcript_13354/m.31295 type:complete len:86 (-) Transcript_13354:118-375(-)
MLFFVLPANQLQLPSTYAGYNVPENSPLNPGMAMNSRSNSYWWPSAPENDGWKFSNYDMPGSYAEPVVNPYEPVNRFSGNPMLMF